MKIVRLAGHEDLPDPSYQTSGSAGVDLHAAITEPLSVAAGQIALVPTGVKLAIPRGFEGQVRPRSGWARRGLTVVNAPGTIDSDYRGEIQVLLTCLASEPCVIQRGDRIAQIVFSPVARAIFESTTELAPSERGEAGFGHTGTGSRRES